MIGTLITILIYILILGILWWAIDYAITNIPIPDPPARIIRIVVVIIFALIVILLLLQLVGIGTGLDLRMPRINP